MLWLKHLNRFMDTNKKSMLIFLLIGGVTAAFYLSMLHCLLEIFHFDYHVAISMAYSATIILYFFANRTFTFKSRDKKIGHQFAKFLLLVLINYLLTLFIVHNGVELLKLSPYLATLLAIISTTASNYLLAKTWIFKQPEIGD